MPRQLISSAMDVNTSLANFEAVIAEHGGALLAKMSGRRKKGTRQLGNIVKILKNDRTNLLPARDAHQSALLHPISNPDGLFYKAHCSGVETWLSEKPMAQNKATDSIMSVIEAKPLS